MSAAACVVLVPVASAIDPDCDRALRELEARGYEVRRVYGHAAIDQARSQMATDALADGFDQLMWIDSDVLFDPAAVERLRSHDLPIVGGIYVKKAARALACHLLSETECVEFGAGGGLLPIRYAAAGFMLTRRALYDRIRETHALPICNEARGRPMIPFFLPMLLSEPGGSWYLGEDYAFSERARRAGFEIFADTSLRLGHVGRYAYGWEDAGGSHVRYASYRFQVAGKRR